MLLFILIILDLKFIGSDDINASFLRFAWSIFSPPFTFNLCGSLKYILCRWHIVESCFLFILAISSFSLDCSVHLYLIKLLIWLDLSLFSIYPICFFSSFPPFLSLFWFLFFGFHFNSTIGFKLYICGSNSPTKLFSVMEIFHVLFQYGSH